MAVAVNGQKAKKLINIYNQKGLTLVEMMISLAVLSIFAVVIIQSVSFNFISTIFIGEKSQANAAAQKKMERITAIVNNSGTLTELQRDPDFVTSDQLFTYNQDLEPRFFIEETANEVGETTVNGYEVTVVVFYRDGRAYVELPRFIEINND